MISSVSWAIVLGSVARGLDLRADRQGCRTADWAFRSTIDLTASQRGMKYAELEFEGLDTFASVLLVRQVWLCSLSSPRLIAGPRSWLSVHQDGADGQNGKSVLEADNHFTTYKAGWPSIWIPLSSFWRFGKGPDEQVQVDPSSLKERNELVIQFKSPWPVCLGIADKQGPVRRRLLRPTILDLIRAVASSAQCASALSSIPLAHPRGLGFRATPARADAQFRGGSCNLGNRARMGIRKSQYHFRWDWGPEVVCIGPDRPIHLRLYNSRLRSVTTAARVDERLNKTLAVKAEVEGGGRVRVRLLDGERVVREEVGKGSPVQWEALEVGLWWSVGKGEAKRYELRVDLLGEVGAWAVAGWADEAGRHHHRQQDQQDRLSTHPTDSRPPSRRTGKELLLWNQQPTHLHRRSVLSPHQNTMCARWRQGSNWIPIDNILPSGTPERYRQWLELMASETWPHVLMLRSGGTRIWFVFGEEGCMSPMCFGIYATSSAFSSGKIVGLARSLNASSQCALTLQSCSHAASTRSSPSSSSP